MLLESLKGKCVDSCILTTFKDHLSSNVINTSATVGDLVFRA